MGWRAEISKGRGNGRGLADDKQSGRPGGKKKSASNKFTRTASSCNTELLTDSEVGVMYYWYFPCAHRYCRHLTVMHGYVQVVALITLPGLRTDVTDELFREVTRSVPFLHGKELGFVELVAPQMEFVRLEKDELVIQEGESGKDAGLFFVLTVCAGTHKGLEMSLDRHAYAI